MPTKTLNIKGPAGIKGPTGNQGATGNTGAQGSPGSNGATGPPGVTAVSTDTGNQATLGTDSKIFVPPRVVPIADTTKNGLLAQVSGLTTDYVSGGNSCQDLGTNSRPQIWSVRQRNYNALCNPNFEVTIKNRAYQTSTYNFGGSGWAADRWSWTAVGGFATAHTTYPASNSPVSIPGAGTYCISQNGIYVGAQTAVTTIGAGDRYVIGQMVEGPMARELLYSPTSISLLVQSNFAPFTFSISLRNSAGTYSLLKSCTITTTNWTLIQLPNIPSFMSSGGSFPITVGSGCYIFGICLACGTTYTAPSWDTWLSGNYLAGPTQGNFFASGSGQIYFAFVQHEPSTVCNNLIDIPYWRNLRECQRYYCNSLGYGNRVVDIGGNSYKRTGQWIGGTTVRGFVDWPVQMATTPAVLHYGYNVTTGSTIFVDGYGANSNISTYNVDSRGIQSMVLSATPATGTPPTGTLGEWVAETNW